MAFLSRLLFATGTVLLLHAAYSCLHYRSLLRELEDSGLEETQADESYRMPRDVVLETGMGFVMLLLSELMQSGSSLQPVVGPKQRPLVAPPYQSRDFDIYAARSKAL